MCGKSHQHLGKHLARQYMQGIPKRYIYAFLIGCIQPDRNPATYLKGSIREKWLRGHDWKNAQRFMQKIALRLEQRECLKLLDYYTIGKLIHYTMDAFTSAHNEHFSSKLMDHRAYELDLQQYFLRYLSEQNILVPDNFGPLMDTIRHYHRKYIQIPANVHTDSHFAILVCSVIISRLLPMP